MYAKFFVSEWCLYHFSQWKTPAWRYIVQKLTKIANWKLTKLITYQKIGKITVIYTWFCELLFL